MDVCENAHPNEVVISNGRTGDVRLTIAVPTYKDAAAALLQRLAGLKGARGCRTIVYDDGSGDPALSQEWVKRLNALPGPAILVQAAKNQGRAIARNRLLTHATTDWILFLDADMDPDAANFLTAYLDLIAEQSGPALICGGFSLHRAHVTRATALHAVQSRRSECVPAKARQMRPGQYVFTSNLLVHQEIMATITFDPSFQGWGWEDVDWGLRVAAAYPVLHIDNTATHLGLDETAGLMEKFGCSGGNFARLLAKHPDLQDTLRLARLVRTLRRVPFRGGLRQVSAALARDQFGVIPMRMRLAGLKLYRAASYAEVS